MEDPTGENFDNFIGSPSFSFDLTLKTRFFYKGREML